MENNKAPTTTNDKNNDYITTEVTDNKIACAFCGITVSLELAGLTSRGKRALYYGDGGHWFCKHCIQRRNLYVVLLFTFCFLLFFWCLLMFYMQC